LFGLAVGIMTAGGTACAGYRLVSQAIQDWQW
jgi:hypothetical protein